MSKAYLPASPEEMAEWERWFLLPAKYDYGQAILRLIATIRERDTRIKELEADLPPPGYLRRPGFLPNITVARRSEKMPLPKALADNISEEDFTAAVIAEAQRLGWLVHHCRPARTAKGWVTPIQGDEGFVDIFLVRDCKFRFWELKSEKGTISPEQGVWLTAIDDGMDLEDIEGWQDVRALRPSDWDWIQKELE